LRSRKLILLLALAALLAGTVLGGVPSAGAETTSIECEGDSCQVLPSPPEEPAIGTELLTPEVNPPPHFPKPKKARGKKKHNRAARGGR